MSDQANAGTDGSKHKKTNLTKTLSVQELLKREECNEESLSVALPESNASVVRHDWPITVSVRVVFLNIGYINTLEECFKADIFAQFRWREPRLQKKSEDIIFDPSQYWNPNIHIENIINEPKSTKWHALSRDDEGFICIVERQRVKAIFHESMELDQFPFDIQDLCIKFITERSTAEVVLQVDAETPSSVNMEGFGEEQEWELFSQVEHKLSQTMPRFTSASFHQHKLSIMCKAGRRPGFFLWNVHLTMAFICALTFATFTVSHTLPQNRLQLAFIMFLTNVTFKFAASQNIPKISYQTYLDRYILLSMFTMMSVTVWHAIIPEIFDRYGDSTTSIADSIALIVLGTCFILAQLAYFIAVYFLAWKHRKRYQKTNESQAIDILPLTNPVRTLKDNVFIDKQKIVPVDSSA